MIPRNLLSLQRKYQEGEFHVLVLEAEKVWGRGVCYSFSSMHRRRDRVYLWQSLKILSRSRASAPFTSLFLSV